MTDIEMDPDLIRQQLDRMAKSAAFAQAGRMFPLLEYLVAAELNGSGGRLDQRRIAIDVFGRDSAFDPTCDAIVRVEFGRLRNKLREYYAADGRGDDLLVEVPRGRYRIRIKPANGAARFVAARLPKQTIQHCRTPDGIKIAYSTLGEGYPLISLPHWLSHLEADINNPFIRHYWVEFSRRFRLIRYDARGFGLSQRKLPKLEFDDFVTDLETVVEALGLERFAMLGPSGGAPVGAAYAARHPERVSHLMLLGGFIRGPRRVDAKTAEFAGIVQAMIRHGWGQSHSRFRNFFVSMLVPDGSPELYRRMDEAQLAASSGANAERFFGVTADFDLSDEVRRIRSPTLVFHGIEETGIPYREAEYTAARIPGARLVPLPTRNHVLMPDDPAWPQLLCAMESFVLNKV